MAGFQHTSLLNFFDESNASLVKALVEYLVDVAKIEDVKEIPMGEL